jgi:hypothetical protein
MTNKKDLIIFIEHLFINCANAIDAFATLTWVKTNIAHELNPLMGALIEYSPSLFISVKLTLLPILSIFLWQHRSRKLVIVSGHILCLIYLIVMIIHLMIGMKIFSYLDALSH